MTGLILHIVPGVAVAAGIVMVIFCAAKWIAWQRVRNWGRTTGRVVRAELQQGVYHAYPVPLTLYIPSVRYEYSWGGKIHFGERITVRDRRLASVDKDKVQGLIAMVGEQPDVFVDPENPENAVLVNRLESHHYDFLLTYTVAGVLLVLAGIGIFTMQ